MGCPNTDCKEDFRVTPAPDEVATEERITESLGKYKEKSKLTGILWTIKPLISYLSSSTYYYLRGFSIINREGGEDRIQCNNCEEIYKIEETFTLDIVTSERDFEE